MQRLLVAGFGDIARRAAPALTSRFAITALSRETGFELDATSSPALAPTDALLHCVPPPSHGDVDTRTAHLLAALDASHVVPRRFVYISTSGVYGDCAGARVDESWPRQPHTARAKRRADAEVQLERWCAAHAVALVILRAPGIYASDRLPLERLRAR